MSRGRRDYASDEAETRAAWHLCAAHPENKKRLPASLARRVTVLQDAALEPIRLWLEERAVTANQLLRAVLYGDDESAQLDELAEASPRAREAIRRYRSTQ